jgi:two-component system phosphate regulon sensor histidine kinase PhoR
MGTTEEARRLFTGKIRAESQRMSKLVGDIIDLSRLDSGGVGMPRELTDLHRIALNAVEALQSEAESAAVTVAVEGGPTLLYGVPLVLYSIIYNLCSNAINYSNKGGKVLVTVRDLPGKAQLTVSDQGIGIPSEDLDRIFERFYRVDKSHSKEVGGTGLGLSIVKHAAGIHNAEIQVRSELGKGSDFTVTFPK